MTPSSGSLSARPGARCASGRLRRSTMGRFVDSSCSCSTLSTRQTRRASSAEAIMTANALPWRRLRWRNWASASGFSASHTKWKPPSPLTATMPPAMSTRTAAAKMATDASRVLPQAIDQARSSGQGANESASDGHGVESIRSAGRQIETAGPHSQQASGCAWKRLSAGSAYSPAQRGHISKVFIDVAGRS